MSNNVITADERAGVVSLPLASFRRETHLWPRKGFLPPHVNEFKRLYRAGGPPALPPIVVLDVEGKSYLADGWYRCAAALRLGFIALPATLKRGSRLEDVYLEALAASAATDRPLTRMEKRAVVDRLLTRVPGYSDRHVARLAGVCQPFVSGLRKLLNRLPEGETSRGSDLSPFQQEARKLIKALIALEQLYADLRHYTGAAPVQPDQEIAAAARACGGAAAEKLLARLALWAPKAHRAVAGEAERGNSDEASDAPGH
jgi:hypothetical protein